MNAERNYVIVMQAILFDLFLAKKNAVGAVQVLDDTTAFVTYQLCVMAADEFTLDVNLIVR